MDLERVMLDKCIEFFKRVYDEKDSFYDEKKYEEIPYDLFVEYCEDYYEDGIHYGLATEKLWKYENSTLIETSLPDYDQYGAGTFFRLEGARIYWDLENNKAYLELLIGPIFGIRYSYDIVFDGGNAVLENEEIVWKSIGLKEIEDEQGD